MDRQTDRCHEGQSDPIWHQQGGKQQSHSGWNTQKIIILKGFDKGVGDKHLFGQTPLPLVNRKSFIFPSLRNP